MPSTPEGRARAGVPTVIRPGSATGRTRMRARVGDRGSIRHHRRPRNRGTRSSRRLPTPRPLIVPRVRHYLTDVLKCSDDQRLAWIQHWLGAGLQAIETLLAEHPTSGRFCHGERPTIADICLVTQVTPAMTFNLSLDPYPRVMRVYNTCMAIPAFADAHPSKQPDAE